MEYAEYLSSKKIDAEKFKKGDPELFNQFQALFDQVHPDSFTQQKLFLINQTRRKYLLETVEVEKPKPSAAKMKPKILPKKPKI